MKQIRKMTNPLISEMEKVLNRALDNVYINTALKVFLVLYAALAAPKFPPKLVFLMDNTIVRICVAFLIVFMALRDPAMALMIAIAFIVTLQTANRLRLYNTDLSIGIPGETSWLPSVKEMFFNDHTDCSGADEAVTAAEAVLAAAQDADPADQDAVKAAKEELKEAELALVTCNDPGAVAADGATTESSGSGTDSGSGSGSNSDSGSDSVSTASDDTAGDDVPLPEVDGDNADMFESFSVYPSSGAKYSYAPFN